VVHIVTTGLKKVNNLKTKKKEEEEEVNINWAFCTIIYIL
jgi:hypothetical protein